MGSVETSLKVGDFVYASDIIGEIGHSAMIEVAQEAHVHLESSKTKSISMQPRHFLHPHSTLIPAFELEKSTERLIAQYDPPSSTLVNA